MPVALPKPLLVLVLLLPLEEQETSYLAASAKILSFSKVLWKDILLVIISVL
jgi:hypothetical protein